MTTQFSSLPEFTAVQLGDEIAVARGNTTGRISAQLLQSNPTHMHNLIVGWSLDQTISDAELMASREGTNEAMSNSITIPEAPTGEPALQYLFIWRSDADGGDPAVVNVAGSPGFRNAFGTAAARQFDGVDGQLLVTGVTQNSLILSLETLTVS